MNADSLLARSRTDAAAGGHVPAVVWRACSAWGVPAIVIVFLTAVRAVAGAPVPAPADVLETLRAFDATHKAGFSGSGQGTIVVSNDVDKGVPVTWKLSSEGNRVVLSEVATQVVPPTVDPKPYKSNAPLKGKQTVGLLVKRTVLLGPEYSAEIGAYTDIRDEGKDPQTLDGAKLSWVVKFYPPQDPGLVYPIQRALWSSGRGFAQHIKEITRVETGQGGTLALQGRGNAGSRTEGTWELTVDVSAGYLVRQARFTRDGAAEPELEVTTSGVKTAGGISVAASGQFKDQFQGKVGEMGQSLAAAAAAPDQELWQAASQSLLGPYPGQGVLIDRRFSPASSFTFKPGYRYNPAEGKPGSNTPDPHQVALNLRAKTAIGTMGDPVASAGQASARQGGRQPALAGEGAAADARAGAVQAAASASRRSHLIVWVSVLCITVLGFCAYVYFRRRGIKAAAYRAGGGV